MTHHPKPRLMARNASALPKLIRNGQTVRLSTEQIGHIYAGIDSLVLPEALFKHLRTQKGKVLQVPATLIREVATLNPDLAGSGPVEAYEAVTTTVVVVVLVASAVAGFAAGYFLSDAADGKGGGGGVEITNNEGNVTVCPDGEKND